MRWLPVHATLCALRAFSICASLPGTPRSSTAGRLTALAPLMLCCVGLLLATSSGTARAQPALAQADALSDCCTGVAYWTGALQSATDAARANLADLALDYSATDGHLHDGQLRRNLLAAGAGAVVFTLLLLTLWLLAGRHLNLHRNVELGLLTLMAGTTVLGASWFTQQYESRSEAAQLTASVQEFCGPSGPCTPVVWPEHFEPTARALSTLTRCDEVGPAAAARTLGSGQGAARTRCVDALTPAATTASTGWSLVDDRRLAVTQLLRTCHLVDQSWRAGAGPTTGEWRVCAEGLAQRSRDAAGPDLALKHGYVGFLVFFGLAWLAWRLTHPLRKGAR